MVYKHHASVSRPFDQTDPTVRDTWAEFVPEYQAAWALYTIEEHEYRPIDIYEWKMQTHEIAKGVYTGVIIDSTDPGYDLTPLDEDTYVLVWQPIAERQVVLAGYRLAEIMRLIYGKPLEGTDLRSHLSGPSSGALEGKSELAGEVDWNSGLLGE